MKTTSFSKTQFKKLILPESKSHKGENGRVLVIGGSSLFHSASLWAAELLAHFADLVFYYSPALINRQLFLGVKRQFRNGIVVDERDLDAYIHEAEVVLLGPGLMRAGPEGKLAHDLTNKLLAEFPAKKIVLDAGALQQLETKIIRPPFILTPHWGEFTHLFPQYLENFDRLIKNHPATYLIKKSGIDYIVSHEHPNEIIKVQMGNEGLTKGGTGDLLAALTAAFYVKNPASLAAGAASYLLNTTADDLYQEQGPFYTTTELLNRIPPSCWRLLKS